MVTKASFPLICCFLSVMVLYIIPWGGLAARKLEDIPPNGNVTGYNQKKEQSKSGVHGSQSGHAGSATGHNSPSGTVQMPPPTSVNTVNYENGNSPPRNQNGQVTNGGQQYYSPPEYQGNRYFSPPSYQGNPYYSPGNGYP